MPADVFSRRIDDDISTEFERTHKTHADRIVDHKGNAGFVGDLGQFFKVRHIELGIADRLREDSARFRADGAAKGFGISGVDELNTAAELWQRIVEELIGPAIEIISRHDLVSDLGDVEQRQTRRRLTRGHGKCADPAFEGGDPLFKYVRSWVMNTGVNVAEFF